MNAIVFILLAAALIGLAFYLVALPLLLDARRQARPASMVSEQERLAELLAQRDATFQALRELSFDHKVGKITNEDFTAFEANLKQNAAQTLRALDEWEAESDVELDDVLEEAILSRKLLLAGAALAGAGRSIGDQGEPDGRICAKCRRPALTGDKFCGGCGAALPPTAAPSASRFTKLACPNCGQPHAPADSFCAKCGQSLAAEVAPAAQ